MGREHNFQPFLSYAVGALLEQVYLNDLLTCSYGHILELYTKDEQLGISDSLVEVVEAKGIPPVPSACWNFFVQKVRAWSTALSIRLEKATEI